jgi:hypothetical protein
MLFLTILSKGRLRLFVGPWFRMVRCSLPPTRATSALQHHCGPHNRGMRQSQVEA